MIKIENSNDCCGCTACYNACFQKAISMIPDEEGFLYPIADTDLCIDCGICDKVCPIKNKIVSKNTELESYVLRSKNNNVLMNSTSGGFITPLATYVLDHYGVVCAASYDNDFKVKHIIIDNLNGGGTTYHGSEVLSM